MPSVAEMIRVAMERIGYSQQRLAGETDITAPWINQILRQEKKPGPAALLRIADALGIDRRRLVRQAHYERACEEWKPYLGPADPAPEGPDGAGAGLTPTLPVIGTACAGASDGEVDVAPPGRDPAARAAAVPPEAVGFHSDCKAIRVAGDSLEPVAYDGQYVVISPLVRKEEIADGSIVYVTYELPGESSPRAMVKRMYRYRLAGEGAERAAVPVYVFVPVNAHLRFKGRSPEPQEALTLRHRQVREMFPVVGVIFGDTA